MVYTRAHIVADRLSYLGLDSLCCRQVKADLIVTYNILLNRTCLNT